jgi:hypothetical protein
VGDVMGIFTANKMLRLASSVVSGFVGFHCPLQRFQTKLSSALVEH